MGSRIGVVIQGEKEMRLHENPLDRPMCVCASHPA